MRIYLEGNEELAKWHLPVATTKFTSFITQCRDAGLAQGRFTFVFDEDGTSVFGQYYFGESSLQIYAPTTVSDTGKSKEREERITALPKTFWVNTSTGYYWVEVRYTDGVPVVYLTKFIAEVINAEGVPEFVYTGMVLNSPGMRAGCFSDDKRLRYVIAQNGGIMTGADESKGGVVSPRIVDDSSRISALVETEYEHSFFIMQNSAQSVEARVVTVAQLDGVLSLDRKYLSLSMPIEGESLPVQELLPNPCWVHRKCTGSYFSPNKTIGYHVDIGTDDDFWGNITVLGGGLQDKLDNTGGAVEVLFNHTPDLYRLISLFAFPTSASGSKISFVVCCPTMLFQNDINNDKKCWGGYGITADWCGCADYGQDFDSWMLAPRPVLCVWDYVTGEKVYSDFLQNKGGYAVSYTVQSWCGNFHAKALMSQEYSCDKDYYNVLADRIVDACTWTEAIHGNCDPGFDPVGYSGFAAYENDVLEHWAFFVRENIRNTKKIAFVFGGKSPDYSSVNDILGYYFLFDGFWHLDVGVHWSSMSFVGNSCGIMSDPLMYQIPGELVYFFLCGSGDGDWILENGHEYVENLDIVEPLGIYHMTGTYGSVTRLGFIARVPEEYETPHDPVVCVGGVRYKASEDIGEHVSCERKITTTPCTCESNPMVWAELLDFYVFDIYYVYFTGGCPPFNWVGKNVYFIDEYNNTLSPKQLEQSRSARVVSNSCTAEVEVVDACMTKISLEAEYYVEGIVTGENILLAGDSGAYYHNLGPDAVYTGEIPGVTFSGETGNGAVVTMPEGAEQNEQFTISFEGKCNTTASKVISAGVPCTWDPASLNPVDAGTYPQVGQWIYNGECYQKVSYYYTTVSGCCDDCPEEDYFLSPCNWDYQIAGAVKVYKVESDPNCPMGTKVTHYVWTIGEKTWGNPC